MAVALFEVSPSLVLVGCREVIGALGAVFAGKDDFVGVHCAPSCLSVFSCGVIEMITLQV